MDFSNSDSPRPDAPALQVEVRTAGRHSWHVLWLAPAIMLLAIATGVTLIAWSPGSSPEPASPLLASPESASGVQPAITWSENEIDVILSPGESASRSFTITSSVDLTNVTIEAVATISPFLTIKPTTISKLRANKAQKVDVTFAIPTNATLGTYDGTIHLRVGTQTYPQTLKVAVAVWQSLTTAWYSVRIPAGFPTSDETSPAGVHTLLISTVAAGADLAIQINTVTAPAELALLDDLEPALGVYRLISRQNLPLDGHPAVRFELGTPEGVLIQYDALVGGVLIEISATFTVSTEQTIRRLLNMIAASIQF